MPCRPDAMPRAAQTGSVWRWRTGKAPNSPTDPGTLLRLRQLVEVGELNELGAAALPAWRATWSRT